MNDRFVVGTGRPSKLLRYFRRMSGNPKLTVPWRLIEGASGFNNATHADSSFKDRSPDGFILRYSVGYKVG